MTDRLSLVNMLHNVRYRSDNVKVNRIVRAMIGQVRVQVGWTGGLFKDFLAAMDQENWCLLQIFRGQLQQIRQSIRSKGSEACDGPIQIRP